MPFSKADAVTNRSDLIFSVWPEMKELQVGQRLSINLFLLPILFCKWLYVAWLGKNEIDSHGHIPAVQSLRDMFGDADTNFPVFFLLQAVFTSSTLRNRNVGRRTKSSLTFHCFSLNRKESVTTVSRDGS